ncbi:MAG: hypothetical protein LQ340_000602 [Diploschistes diacapsis]|nr:MAG: hypothetical protein LQ340_000602 [Diploschistes diacapsis]
MSYPEAIFGCSSVGEYYMTPEQVEELVSVLQKVGITHLDTAARYPPTNPGHSEKVLGENNVPSRFTLDTKIKLVGFDSKGSLTAQAIDDSIAEQFSRLKVTSVNTLYCHAPDTQTPLEEQLAAVDKHYRAGKFKHLGVANFSAQMVNEMIQIAEKKGYVKPTVYQGHYNLICRGPEAEILPLLKRHGIKYNAYSPLAGGFLTGKLTKGETSDTRFMEGNKFGQYYKMLYDKPEMHTAIKELESITQEANLSITEAALRWIFYHSALDKNDGVILGGSKPRYPEQNIADMSKGPLPKSVVDRLDKIWGVVENAAPAT